MSTAIETFRCPRCRRLVRTDWPSGEQTVFVFVQRFFRTTQRDGSQTAEPAGSAQGQMCLFCDIEVWNRVREVLGTRVEG